jgi:hypothetical protein
MKEDVLKQLLEELLSSADETAPIGHGLSADDLDINKQVIELVVNAGLMVLTQHRSVTGSLPLRMSPFLMVDDLVNQGTRCLAAIRITVRKAPEVLVLETKDTVIADWLLVRMCAVLSQTKSARIRQEIVSTLAEVLKMWREANPKSWNDLRKCTETIKSYVSR